MTSTSRLASVLLPLVVACLSGCDSMQIRHDYDPAADFSRLKTYAWMAAREGAVQDPRLDSSLLESRVQGAVDVELGTKGYAPETVGAQADFLVGYFATLDKKVDVSVMNDYYGYGPGPGWRYGYWGGPSSVYVDEYEEGTLILDIVDAKTKKLLWRGSATDRVDLSSSPERKQERIRDAVRRILATFPPPAKGS